MAAYSTSPNENNFSLTKVRLSEGISDYPHWMRNARPTFLGTIQVFLD